MNGSGTIGISIVVSSRLTLPWTSKLDVLGVIVIRRVLADAAYGSHDNFDVLRNKGIEAGIRTAHDASMRTSGHTFARSMAVKKEGAW